MQRRHVRHAAARVRDTSWGEASWTRRWTAATPRPVSGALRQIQRLGRRRRKLSRTARGLTAVVEELVADVLLADLIEAIE